MHPSELPPKHVYVLDGTDTAGNRAPRISALDEQVFHRIDCTAAASIIVTGFGIFEYVGSVADDATAAKYIDPLTGAPFTDKDIFDDSSHGAGFYEKIDTEAMTVPMIAGQTMFGKFKTIDTNGTTFKGFAYARTK